MTGAYSGRQRRCTVSDRGEQGVTIEGNGFSYGREFLEPIVLLCCDIIYAVSLQMIVIILVQLFTCFSGHYSGKLHIFLM